MLNRLFRPRWEHPRAQVRVMAVARLDPMDPVLHRIAREDADVQVRCAAVDRLGNLTILHQVMTWDPEPRVSGSARERLCQVLCEPTDADLEPRLALVRELGDTDLALHLLENAQEEALRLAALEALDDAQWYVRLAREDPSWRVRQRAVGGIDDEAVLEALVKQGKRSDKRLQRVAGERLTGLREQRLAVEQAATLMAELVALGEADDPSRQQGRLRELEQQWQALPEDVRSEGFEARLEGLRASCRTLDALRGAKRALISRVEAGPGDAELGPWLESLDAQWAALDGLPREEETRLRERFAAARRACLEQARRADQQQRHATALALLLEEGAELENSLEKGRLEDWNHRWRQAMTPSDGAWKTRFQALSDHLQVEQERQVTQYQERVREAQMLADGLKRALEAGELRKAISERDRLRARVKGLGESREAKRYSAVLRDAEPGIRELEGWRSWGSGRVRQDLLAEAQALPEEGLSVDALAGRIKQLREAWRQLDRKEGAAPQDLWGAFDGACSLAYGPCQAHYEQQNQQREDNLERRRAFLQELNEGLSGEAAEEPVDWAGLDRRLRRARSQWRELGPVARGKHKAVEREFRQSLERIEQHLAPVRERERVRRLGLIREAKTLVEQEDLQRAIQGVKELQARWKPLVTGRRGEEQALWESFRGACDAVFARRDVQRQEVQSARAAETARREALCERMEGLCSEDGVGLKVLLEALEDTGEAWERAGEGRPAGELQRRFGLAQAALRSRIAGIREAEEARRWETLGRAAALCDALEQMALGGGGVEMAWLVDQQSQWQALPNLPARLSKPLEQRHGQAMAALESGGEALERLREGLDEGQKRRERICLQVEIACGVDSPPAFQAEKMRMQVERLAQSLSAGGGGDAPEVLDKLREEWYLAGPFPAAARDGLEARFQSVLATCAAPTVDFSVGGG